ncbi:MAG: Holliday junction branch migration protein RuvA [Cytophagales bacterium]|nr:MAG: Holliday junction branch migration protein RuvA [Cytophagales bacterium]
MIAYIHGKLAHKEPAYVIIDVGGVGYHIRISLNTYTALGAVPTECRLYTHLQIKEDAHTLFGFADTFEKKIFLDLISVTGVGANTAMMILSSLSTREAYQAIAREEVRIIQSVKGIGAKIAQRIILELKDKIRKDVPDLPIAVQLPAHQTAKEEALLALTTLGIPKNVAEKNLDILLKQKKDEEIKVEELIKMALRM